MADWTAKPVSPFGVFVGDTYPFPSVQLIAQDGGVVDPSGLTVSLERWDAMGAESSMPGVINANVIEFPWGTDDTVTTTIWQTMVRVDDGSIQFSLPTPMLKVYDPTAMYCTVGEVEAIVGSGKYSQWEILSAIQVAETVVRAWVTVPIGSPVPSRVRMATALLAARALTHFGEGGVGGPAVVEERIADYSVRYAESSSGGMWLLTDDVANLLLPWKPRNYTTDIGTSAEDAIDATADYLTI